MWAPCPSLEVICMHSITVLTNITQQELGFEPRAMSVTAQAQCRLCVLIIATLGQATIDTSGTKLFTEMPFHDASKKCQRHEGTHGQNIHIYY